MKSDPPRSSSNSDAIAEKDREAEDCAKNVRLTSANFAELSGRVEMTENRLRVSQNRYLLHRKYSSKAFEGV